MRARDFVIGDFFGTLRGSRQPVDTVAVDTSMDELSGRCYRGAIAQ
jgi:hypothetical protein